MKIYQIISEAPSTTAKPSLVNDAGKWKWKLPDGSMLGGFTDQKAAIDWAKNNPSSLTPSAQAAAKQRWDATKAAPPQIDPKTGKPVQGLKAPTAAQRAKWDKKDIPSLAEKAKAAGSKYKAIAEKKWAGKFGFAFRSGIGALQLAGACIELYTVRAAADEYEEEGLLSPENAQIMRDYALRKFTLEVTAQIALWASSAALAKILVSVVRGSMLAVGIATGGAGLTALVASEVFMQAFLAYIKTENGREFFARYLAGVLIDDDSMIGSVTGQLLDYIGMSTKVPGEKQKVSGLPTSNNQTATA